MKKYCKALSIALALLMVLNVIAPIKADAKTTVWQQTEGKSYYTRTTYDSETGESSESLELSYEWKSEYDKKGNTKKYTETIYNYDYETGKTTKETTVATYAYKNGKLAKISYSNGGYAIYEYKKNIVSSVKEYDKNKKLVYETNYTYDSKGRLLKYLSKRNGKMSYEVEYKNGIRVKSKSYNDKGKLSCVTTYDKHGNALKEEGTTYDYETGKKSGTYTTTYKNTYVKDVLSKVVYELIYSEGNQNKSEITYYTSGKLKGEIKAETYYYYNSETKKYENLNQYTYSYKTDKAGHITERTSKNKDGKIMSKSTYKWKKFTY